MTLQRQVHFAKCLQMIIWEIISIFFISDVIVSRIECCHTIDTKQFFNYSAECQQLLFHMPKEFCQQLRFRRPHTQSFCGRQSRNGQYDWRGNVFCRFLESGTNRFSFRGALDLIHMKFKRAYEIHGEQIIFNEFCMSKTNTIEYYKSNIN